MIQAASTGSWDILELDLDACSRPGRDARDRAALSSNSITELRIEGWWEQAKTLEEGSPTVLEPGRPRKHRNSVRRGRDAGRPLGLTW